MAQPAERHLACPARAPTAAIASKHRRQPGRAHRSAPHSVCRRIVYQPHAVSERKPARLAGRPPPARSCRLPESIAPERPGALDRVAGDQRPGAQVERHLLGADPVAVRGRRSAPSPARSSRWVGMSRSPVRGARPSTIGPSRSSISPASAVILARSGGAASGITSSAVKRKRSSPRVVPVKVGLLILSPLPSASTSPRREDHAAADAVVGLDQEQRREHARAPPAAAPPSGSPRPASSSPGRRPPWLRPTPARRQSCTCRMPAGRPGASGVGGEERGDLARVHHPERLRGQRRRGDRPRRRASSPRSTRRSSSPAMCRRRSPSVTIPTSRPRASTTPTTPKPLRRHLDQRLGHRRLGRRSAASPRRRASGRATFASRAPEPPARDAARGNPPA